MAVPPQMTPPLYESGKEEVQMRDEGVVPLCAMPNLCVSTLMLVTPGTEKSKGGTR